MHVPEAGRIFECKAKGIFRNLELKPLVGDNVNIETAGLPDGEGTITDIYPRINELTRPAVANVDQALVIFAAAHPAPNLNLLDRFLIMMQWQRINTIICFNKKDIVPESEMSLLINTYLMSGYKVVGASVTQKDNLPAVYELIKGKTTVLAGPSGVGKSSLVNEIKPEANMETGSVSEKIKRGKHTTRHSELIYVEENTYVMDTPGFSSLYINQIDKEELKDYFLEFTLYEEQCRFKGCMHLDEPGCAVKEALNEGRISNIRYENYKDMYRELKDIRKY